MEKQIDSWMKSYHYPPSPFHEPVCLIFVVIHLAVEARRGRVHETPRWRSLGSKPDDSDSDIMLPASPRGCLTQRGWERLKVKKPFFERPKGWWNSGGKKGVSEQVKQAVRWADRKKCSPGGLHGQPDFVLQLKRASVPEGKPSFSPHIQSCWETLICQPVRIVSLFDLLCLWLFCQGSKPGSWVCSAHASAGLSPSPSVLF